MLPFSRREGKAGAFTAEESDACAGAAADADSEGGAYLTELLRGDLRQSPQEALLVSSAASSLLLRPHPNLLPFSARSASASALPRLSVPVLPCVFRVELAN